MPTERGNIYAIYKNRRAYPLYLIYYHHPWTDNIYILYLIFYIVKFTFFYIIHYTFIIDNYFKNLLFSISPINGKRRTKNHRQGHSIKK